MRIQRIATIFDTTLRPETAGVYCHRALERIADVKHFQPHELDQIPRDGFDLYLNIDDGLRYHLPAECRPSAFWAIDTHLDFDRCRDKALASTSSSPRSATESICSAESECTTRPGSRWRAILMSIASTTTPRNNMTSLSSATSFQDRVSIC